MDTIKQTTANVASTAKGGGIRSILLMVVVILLAYMLYQVAFGKKEKYLSKNVANAKVQQTISGSDLPVGGSNYTYSMWFYVNDWNDGFGSEKVILQRNGQGGKSAPKVYLSPIENNVNIEIECMASSLGGPTQTSTCTLANIPLQRWVNLIISLNTRALDVYMDGKLVRTCVLPGSAVSTSDSDTLFLSPNGQGFDGFTSAIKYIPKTINPQTAYDIYTEGYGGGGLSSMLGKYKLKVALLENGQETREFTL